MNNRQGPKTLVEESLSKVQSLIDPESGSGFHITRGDLEALGTMATTPAGEVHARRFIKDKLRLYVETWIIPNLETAIDKLTRKV